MELSHIVYGGRTIARRPSQYDDCVLSDVFDAILPELAAECDWDMEKDVSTINEARAEFIESVTSTDGYEIMRNIDLRYAWGGNTRLVKIFDEAPFRECLCKHIQKWIDYFKVEPLFSTGDVVTFQLGDKKLIGVINATENGYEPGMYIVSYIDGVEGRPLVRWEYCEKS